jgi:hypothetical protein
MSNETKKKLLNTFVFSDNKRRQLIIEQGKKKLFKNQLTRHSYVNLAMSTIRFISIKTWLMQFLVVLLILVTTMSHVFDQSSSKTIINSYLICLIFSILFFLEEIYKSFISGMWALEQSFKYDLRQHTLVKLMIFGFLDLLIILFISLVAKAALALSIIHLTLYLLVPYNIFCLLIFSTVTMWRNSISRFSLWIIAGMISAGTLFVVTFFDVYKLNIYYWSSSLAVTLIALILVIYMQVKTNIWR